MVNRDPEWAVVKGPEWVAVKGPEVPGRPEREQGRDPAAVERAEDRNKKVKSKNAKPKFKNQDEIAFRLWRTRNDNPSYSVFWEAI